MGFQLFLIFVIVVLAYMIEQRGTRSISEMYVDILKGLKKRGTREEGRQDKIGKRSWEIGNGNLAPVPFTESRRLCEMQPPASLTVGNVGLGKVNPITAKLANIGLKLASSVGNTTATMRSIVYSF